MVERLVEFAHQHLVTPYTAKSRPIRSDFLKLKQTLSVSIGVHDEKTMIADLRCGE
jgi:hypothetical protein